MTILLARFSQEQFDLRNELTSKSLIQALCVVCWKEKEQEWNIPYFEEVLVQSRLPIVRDHLPFLCKQAMEFITANKIDKGKFRFLTTNMILILMTNCLPLHSKRRKAMVTDE